MSALRPEIDLHVAIPPDAALVRLEHRFDGGDGWEAELRGQHGQLQLPKDQRLLWSPWLTFELEPTEKGTRIHGRFGPQPGTWTLFVAVYAFTVLSGGGVALFGVSQWLAKLSPWGLWALAPMAIMLIGLHVLAFLGQRATADQMDHMRAFIGDAFVDDATEWR